MGIQIRISDLARMLKIPITTTRFYTEMGLLKTNGRTKAGHLLYDPDENTRRFKMITELRKKHLTLKQIKKHINQENRSLTSQR